MLELDDIQHILLTRAPALTGKLRVSVVSQWRRRSRVAVRNQGDGAFSRVDAQLASRRTSAG